MSGSSVPMPMTTDPMSGLRPALTMSSMPKNPTPISHRTTGMVRRMASMAAWGTSTSSAPFGSYAMRARSSGLIASNVVSTTSWRICSPSSSASQPAYAVQ